MTTTHELNTALLILLGLDAETAEYVSRAVKSYEPLFEFAKKHHALCEDCGGTGKIYKHADPTTGQWIECPYYKVIREMEMV